MSQDINSIKQQIDQSVYHLDSLKSLGNFENTIVFIGLPGSGKTTIIKYLTGTPFVSSDNGQSLEIDPSVRSTSSESKLKMGSISSNTQIKIPNFYYDDQTSTIYWNCMFDCSNGYPQDIINTLYDNAIFNESKNIKIVLVISEEDAKNKISELRSTLSHLNTLFINDLNSLKASLSAVFTKQINCSDFNDIIPFVKRWEISYEILSYLSKNSHLITFLPHPMQLNLQVSNKYPDIFKDKILENLNKCTGLPSNKAKILDFDKLMLHLGEYEKNILNEIIEHTKNNIVPALFNFCDNHVRTRLRNYENIGTIMNSVNHFKTSLLSIFDNHDYPIFIQKLDTFDSSHGTRLNKKILIDVCKYVELIRKCFSNAFTEINLNSWRESIRTQINEKLTRLSSIGQYTNTEYDYKYNYSVQRDVYIGRRYTNQLFGRNYHKIFTKFETFYTAHRYITTFTAYLTNGSVESISSYSGWTQDDYSRTHREVPDSRWEDGWG
ncbi:hypothetical protein SteCoe_15837 [Stentor coeruleus]|uniref:Uncharacterized protein n=1 Tax=Stentor coeruleus TaxID=5963 RepID=A0A1R2C2W6_9CILI|nr:hypothetical protein SteCoe_15837 [Stentor coeruleus]